MQAVSWLSICGSGPCEWSGIHPSAIAQTRLPMAGIRLPPDEFREAAVRLVLVDEGELVAVEPVEEFVPVDALECLRSAVAGIVDAEDAGVFAASGLFHARGEAATRFDPVADFVVIGSGSGAGGFF